jgi:Coenzyme PQQ synthesis protein D (PqqD)
MISRSSVVVAVKDQVSSGLAGEVVILNLSSGMYYGLNALGARVWELIQEPRQVSVIRDAILGEYDVVPERCEHDLLAVLQQLARERLIEVRDGCPA